jgi:hypothetical protein
MRQARLALFLPPNIGHLHPHYAGQLACDMGNLLLSMAGWCKK